jgi:hypothetical protein
MYSLLHRIFRPRRRDIFNYWDGQRKRSIDPLVAYHRMIAHESCRVRDDLATVDLSSRKPDDPALAAEAWAATERVQQMIRDMFGVKVLADGGLTQYECDDLLADFLNYMERVKKKRNPSPPPSPSTESPSSARSATKRSVVLSGSQTESSAAARSPS